MSGDLPKQLTPKQILSLVVSISLDVSWLLITDTIEFRTDKYHFAPGQPASVSWSAVEDTSSLVIKREVVEGLSFFLFFMLKALCPLVGTANSLRLSQRPMENYIDKKKWRKH